MADFYRICGGLSGNPAWPIAAEFFHDVAAAMRKEGDLNRDRLRPEYLERLYRAGRSSVALRSDEEIIAHAAVIGPEGGRELAEVAMLWVHPDYRGGGWGSRVFDEATAIFRAIGCPAFLLTKSDAVTAMAARRGWLEFGDGLVCGAELLMRDAFPALGCATEESVVVRQRRNGSRVFLFLPAPWRAELQ